MCLKFVRVSINLEDSRSPLCRSFPHFLLVDADAVHGVALPYLLTVYHLGLHWVTAIVFDPLVQERKDLVVRSFDQYLAPPKDDLRFGLVFALRRIP